MQAQTRTDHAFLVQIWNPRGKADWSDHRGASAIYRGVPAQSSCDPSKASRATEKCAPTAGLGAGLAGAQEETIMLRDKDGKESTLISVCQQLFLPKGYQVGPGLSPSQTLKSVNDHKMWQRKLCNRCRQPLLQWLYALGCQSMNSNLTLSSSEDFSFERLITCPKSGNEIA